MSKVIDISMRLNNEKPQLKITDELIFKVNNSKSTMLILNQKMKSTDLNDFEEIDKILEALLGKKAVEEINKMDPPMDFYQSILLGAMAAVTGEEIEELEGRFQESETEE